MHACGCRSRRLHQNNFSRARSCRNISARLAYCSRSALDCMRRISLSSETVISPISSQNLAAESASHSPWLSTNQSSREMKVCAEPGSPCRALLPTICRSIRADSWHSETTTCNPPSRRASSASLISVPRPARLVAMVMRFNCPACATISASSRSCRSFSTSKMQ